MKPFLIAAMVATCLCSAAHAEDIAPFAYVNTTPPALLLNGVIDMRTPLAFRRAMKAHPDARVLALNSIGGAVQGGLLVAEEVHENGFQTVVPDQGECASACAFIFFAGKDRLAVGKLGVHQIFGAGNEQDTQTNLSDVVEALTRYGVDNAVLTTMLRTPSNQMHYFSPDEISRMNINRVGGDDQPTETVSKSARVTDTPFSAVDPEPSEFLPDLVPIPGVKPVYVARQESKSGIDLANRFLLASQRPAKDISSVVADAYASYVWVNDTQMPLSDLITQLVRHAETWPDRRLRVVPGSMNQRCTPDFCYVSGKYEYLQANSARAVRSLVRFTFGIDMVSKQIVTHKESSSKLAE